MSMLPFAAAEALGVLVEIPLKVVNESNLRGSARNPWRLSRVAKAQREAVRWALPLPLRNSGLMARVGTALELVGPVVVTLTRLAPRAYDDDGTVNCMKHVRDEVAAALGLRSDRDPRVQWCYGHGPALRRGLAKMPGVRIEIRAGVPHAA